MNFQLYWHPKYAHHLVSKGDALFISEDEFYYLDAEQFTILDSIITAGGKVSDYVFSSNDVSIQVARLRVVEQLLKKDILANDSDQLDRYHSPLPTQVDKNTLEQHTLGEHSFLWLSVLEKNTKITAVIEQCFSGNPHVKTTCIVVVDDYLDDRLVAVNQYFKRIKKDWLIVKATGHSTLLGPKFSNSKSDLSLHEHPCYECLKTRIIQNSPVRTWLQRTLKTDHIHPYPVYLFSTMSKVIEPIRSYMQNHIVDLEKHIYQWVDGSHEALLHPVDKLPQCPFCGDPELVKSINTGAIELRPLEKTKNSDGGYRYVDRATTLKNVLSHLSPITGIINDITHIDSGSHRESQDTLKIYRVSYFQNTYSQNALTSSTFIQTALGKGVCHKQAQASALGEALERQAAQYTGDEFFIKASASNLTKRTYTPQDLSPFSDQQYQEFSHYSSSELAGPQWVTPYVDDTAIYWTMGWSLRDAQHVYFPAAHCFANTPFEDQYHSLYTHNGNAAGNTDEEAILQGALELIERDAAAIWWYSQVPRPEIDLNIIPIETRTKIATTLAVEWDYWLLDITNNINVNCCVAIGRHKTTHLFVMGFGAHLDPVVACCRALTEMYQLITIKDKVSGPFNFSDIEPSPFLLPKRNTPKKTMNDLIQVFNTNLRDDILYVMETLNSQALNFCVVNYSRPDGCLKTLKVIIPGLCHFWPQLANHRLYTVAVELGWLSKPLAENELNPMGLYL